MSDHDQWVISDIQRDVSSLRSTALANQEAVNARIGNLLRRVSKLEERLETANGEIARLRSLVIDLDNRLTEQEKEINRPDPELCTWAEDEYPL